MSDVHVKRQVEVSDKYIGENPPPPLAVIRKMACLAGDETVLVSLPATSANEEGVAAITATRIIFAPFHPDAGAVCWRRATLDVVSVAHGSADWEETWRIGWPPGSEVHFSYAKNRSLTLTAPSRSSTSREFGDRFAEMVEDLLTDG